jgi:hypothetical protein
MPFANAGPKLEDLGPGPPKYRNDAVRDDVGPVTGRAWVATGPATRCPNRSYRSWNAVAGSVVLAPLPPVEADG